MSILWRSRFLLLLIPCILGLLLFFSFQRQVDNSVLLDQSLAVSNGSSTTHAPDGTPLPQVLLVTAFFPLSKSKHTMGEYEWWLSQFLQHVTTDIYFYAPTEMEPLIRRCRGDLPITVDTTYSSPFEIPPLSPYREHYDKMQRPAALSRTGKVYDYAFWNDAGSFRSTHEYKGWPDPARVQELWKEGSALSGENSEDLLFFPIAGMPHPSMRYWVQDHGPVDAEVSEGARFCELFFELVFSAVLRVPSAGGGARFYAYHDHYLGLNLFVGKDQTLINAIFFLFPSRVIAVWLDDPEAPAHKGMLHKVDDGALGNCGSEWFYYQFWLARPFERNAMRKIWDSKWTWTWWKQRQQCRVTRVTSMKDLLQRQFGSDWQPPRHSIDA
ncbi:hypothetical protein B0H14DRAFT_2750589 [Mycena olivaceomarginata]|nr:hypothetical protein B0H14DRAFT_2750589 [Mycena olivaceomarginata]